MVEKRLLKFARDRRVCDNLIVGDAARMASDAGNDDIIYRMTSQMAGKYRGGSLLKPKPIQRIGVDEHVITHREIFKNLMSFSQL
jgi:hypothetical protein